MIITINGDHGSGKNTISRKVAESLGYEHYVAGDIFRQIAKDKNMTLVELTELMTKDDSIDREVDSRAAKIGEEGNDFIIVGRTAWYFIPHSVKILLKVSEEEGARRILEHLKGDSSAERENEDEGLESVDKVVKSNRKRKKIDSGRYQEYYNVDIWDEKNYDFILNTTKLSIEEVAEKVLEFVKNFNKQ